MDVEQDDGKDEGDLAETRKGKLSEFTPDKRNANKGTKRGLGALDHSLRQYGAGRSILVDKHGNIIAGNKTVERAADIGLEDVIIVQTDGHQLVAVQRTDLDLDSDKAARELAYADNRVGQLDLEFDFDVISEDVAAGIDFAWGFESAELGIVPTADEWGNAMGGLPDEDRAPFQQMTFTLHDTQVETVKEAIAASKALGAFVDTENENSNGNALARICEMFLEANGRG